MRTNVYSSNSMSLPNCELHHIDHVSTETRDATSLYSHLGMIFSPGIWTSVSPNKNVGPVITSLRSSCRPEDLDRNGQDGLSWTCVSRLLQLTVDEMCRLDGSQAQVPAGRSIVCSLLSALSNHLAENISSMCVYFSLDVILVGVKFRTLASTHLSYCRI